MLYVLYLHVVVCCLLYMSVSYTLYLSVCYTSDTFTDMSEYASVEVKEDECITERKILCSCLRAVDFNLVNVQSHPWQKQRAQVKSIKK